MSISFDAVLQQCTSIGDNNTLEGMWLNCLTSEMRILISNLKSDTPNKDINNEIQELFNKVPNELPKIDSAKRKLLIGQFKQVNEVLEQSGKQDIEIIKKVISNIILKSEQIQDVQITSIGKNLSLVSAHADVLFNLKKWAYKCYADLAAKFNITEDDYQANGDKEQESNKVVEKLRSRTIKLGDIKKALKEIGANDVLLKLEAKLESLDKAGTLEKPTKFSPY